MTVSEKFPYILGLDIGVQSVGWAIIPTDGGPDAVTTDPDLVKKCIRCGVRCFDGGADCGKKQWEDGFARGLDKSSNLTRRTARQIRRGFWRRRRRIAKLFSLLQEYGLLPSPGKKTAEERQKLIQRQVDPVLASQYLPQNHRIADHLLPYILRREALNQKLELIAFGRALLHLAQRRGFLSNRKTQVREDENEGKVKTGISELQQQMEECGARTLGEYFASIDPTEHRIRGRYTSREMYKKEFEMIWKKQAEYHPEVLTESLHRKIYAAIFWQRPLKSQKHTIGLCGLESGRRRAQLASIPVQRFRLWQKILDMRICDGCGESRELTHEEQDRIAGELEVCGRLPFSKIRKILNLKKGFHLNYEEEEETGDRKRGLVGNTTMAQIYTCFTDAGQQVLWNTLTDIRKQQIAEEILQFENTEALAQRLRKVFEFDTHLAQTLSRITVEQGYTLLSLAAIRKILPLMVEKRIPFASARKEIYGEQIAIECKRTDGVHELLPPVLKTLSELRNPVVLRALTEVRKVVNAIVRRFGKPAFIHVELARDMKRSRKERQKIQKKMTDREKERETARRAIQERMKFPEVHSGDIEKYLLAEECRWTCPYTGKTITMENLFGSHPGFDIEHIIPYSRSFDNSFSNKTLCDSGENRMKKKNRTPCESYSSDPERWHGILVRLQGFRGPYAKIKLERFLQEKTDEDFSNRMLSDTRFISRKAGEYLSVLYGGLWDSGGTRRIQVNTGGITAILRRAWDLNSILNPGNTGKTREDHRHHAVDAAVIACCNASVVMKLSSASEEQSRKGNRPDAIRIDPPVREFRNILETVIRKIIVSHRCDRSVSGAFHQETFYGLVPGNGEEPGGKKKESSMVRVRKPLATLSRNEVEKIADPHIRERVTGVLGENDPKKFFQNEDNLPFLESRDGRKIPIRRVTLLVPMTVRTIGKGIRERHVVLGENHHMELFFKKEGKKEVPDGDPVSMFEAYQREKRGEPIVKRDHGPGTRFLCSLHKRECLEIYDPENQEVRLYVISTIKSNKQIFYQLHSDAVPAASKKGLSVTPETFVKKGVRKVYVDVLGEIHPAND